MRSLKSYIKEEAYDIRNTLNEAMGNKSTKFYTAKQSVKLLMANLENIPDEDDKAMAVYNALGDPDKVGAWYIVSGEGGSKIIVKDHEDEYAANNMSDKKRDSIEKKYVDAFNAIMQADSTIRSLWERGKDVRQKKIEEEKCRKAEQAKLERTQNYKEFMEEFPGAHLLYKSYGIYYAWTMHHLWTTPKNDICKILLSELNKCKAIKADEAEPGKYYIIKDEKGPNLTPTKEAASSRYNIIGVLSVVKCVGDGKWNVILNRNYEGYKEPSIKDSKVESYFDTNPYVVEMGEYDEALKKSNLKDAVEEYIKEINNDLEKDSDLYPYSEDIKNLIKNDTI